MQGGLFCCVETVGWKADIDAASVKTSAAIPVIAKRCSASTGIKEGTMAIHREFSGLAGELMRAIEQDEHDRQMWAARHAAMAHHMGLKPSRWAAFLRWLFS